MLHKVTDDFLKYILLQIMRGYHVFSVRGC